MGEAREVMDRLTHAVISRDLTGVEACLAPDVVAVTPDAGEITGRDGVMEYIRGFVEAFSDLGYEPMASHESGNVAIDEGYVTGAHSAPLQLASGDTVPATGRRIRLRSCDVGVAEHGELTRYHFYFDQMEFLDQLGLLETAPA